MKTTTRSSFYLRTISKASRKARKSPASILRRGILATSAAALLGVSMLGGTASAVNLFWDNNGLGAGVGFNGASNAWDVVASNWSPDAGGVTTSQAWINGNDAIFQGTTGTVLLSPSISANSVLLSTAYTLNLGNLTLTGGAAALTSTAGGTIGSTVTMSGAAGTITSNGGTLNLGLVLAGNLGLTFAGAGNTTLGSAIANTTTLTKNGAGQVTLTNNNGFTTAAISGGTITGGTLTLSGGGATTLDSSATSAVNSALTFTNAGGSTVNSQAGTLSLGGTVNASTFGLTFAGAGNTTLSNVLSNATTLAKSGAGTLTLANALNNASTVAISGGTIASGTLSLSGGGATTLQSTAASTINSSVTFTNAGGSAVNTVPDRCTIEIDRRVVGGERPLHAPQQMVDYLRTVEGIDFPVELTPCWIAEPALLPAGSEEIVSRLGRAIDSVRGSHRVHAVPFGTDAATISFSGIPAVVFGPGDIAQAHTADEWIAASELAKCMTFLTRLGDWAEG